MLWRQYEVPVPGRCFCWSYQLSGMSRCTPGACSHSESGCSDSLADSSPVCEKYHVACLPFSSLDAAGSGCLIGLGLPLLRSL